MSIRYLRTPPVRIDYPYNNPFWISDSTVSNTSGTGALVVSGGVGVGGNVNIAGKIQSSAMDNTPIGGTTPAAGKFTTLESTGNLVVGGNLTVNGSQLYVQGTNTVYTDNLLELHAPSGGVNGVWTTSDGKDIGIRMHYYNAGDKNAAFVFDPETQYFEFFSAGTETNGVFTGTYGTIKAASFVGDVTGNISTATKLATARNIGLAGDASGSASFDGSADATITLTLASTGVTAGTYNTANVTVDTKGRITAISSGTSGVATVNSKTGTVVLTTNDIAEGTGSSTNNLYFTYVRARGAISVAGSLGYASGIISYTTPNSDGIVEGTTNLYFTDIRAQTSALALVRSISINELADVNAVSPTNGQVLAYNAAAGEWQPAAGASSSTVTSINGQTSAVILTTDNINQGSVNRYYSEALFDARIGTTSINALGDVDTVTALPLTGQALIWNGTAWAPDNVGSGAASLTVQDEGVAQGVTNKINFVGAGVTANFVGGVATVTITGSGTAAVNTVNGQSGTIVLTTDNVNEGNNQYFTTARARGAISVAGSLVYSTATGIVSYTESVSSVAGRTGAIVLTTSDIDEGSNLYFSTNRARGVISSTSRGVGSVSYSSATGIITYIGPSAGEIRGFFTGGTGVTITNGVVSIGQDVGINASPVFNSLSVAGNLTVSGTTTTVNQTTLSISNAAVFLNDGATGTPTSNADIYVVRGNRTSSSLHWNEAQTRWEFFNGSGSYYPMPTSTTDLAEGTNQYFTTARARSAISAASGVSYDSSTGVISLTGSVVSTFNSRTGAVTLTSSDVVAALGYTPVNAANGAAFGNRVVVPAGGGGGLAFPNDPYGGGGDSANITVVSTGGENIQLTLAVTNDAEDTINFVAPSSNGVKINGYTIWHANNLTNLNQLTNGPGYITSAGVPVTSVNSKIGAVSLNIGDLGDVTVTSPGLGQILIYDGTKWANSSGVTGYTGSQGVGYTGSIGYTGSASTVIGYTGSRGADGIIGYNGSIGYTGSAGTNGYTGSRGDTGLGFAIAKTYLSVAALTADTSPTGIVAGQFALIDTSNVENPENSRLYLWNGSVYSYVTDLSGAQGITGPAGSTGYSGSAGANGYTGSAGGIGYTGSQGASGIYSGTSAPADDTYLWLDTGAIGYTSTDIINALGYTPIGTGYLGSSSIDIFADVDTSTSAPTNGQALIWNNAGRKWVPGTVSTTSSLATLTDVDYTTPPTNGQTLVWNSTSSKWYPGASSGGGGGVVTGISIAVSDTAPSSPTTGSLWFNSTAGQLLIYYGGFWIQPSAPEGSGATTSGTDISTSYLNDLYDVVALAPTNGESLIWDTTSGAWIPGGTAKSLGQAPGTVFSYNTTRYRTAKLVCQAVNSTVVEACELLITHNGIAAYSTKYANVTSSGNAPVIVYDASLLGGVVSVTASNAVGFTISVTATMLE